MQDYLQYEAKDFALDESFQMWILQKDPDAVQFWLEWLKLNPEKKEEVEKASDILYALAREKNLAQANDQAEVWGKVHNSLFIKEKISSRKLYDRPWFYAAASISLLFIAVFAYWTLRQQEDQVYFATGFGETLDIVLPDSTLVMLNANSSLTYFLSWNQPEEERVVWMEGEGFFDVSHRDGQKFIVRTEQAAVEVLGTEFNLSERRGNTEVILSTGKVALHLQEQKVLLDPGEKVSYDSENNTVEKKIVNPDLLTSWRNNELVFEATTLADIALLLEDNYGYKVRFEDASVKNLLFSGTIKADKVNLLLEALAETHRLKISQENDTLIFKI